MTTESIVANNADITLMPNAAASQPQFCSIWPGAKTALSLLEEIVKNPIAKGAIGIVIAAGDAVAKKLGCA